MAKILHPHRRFVLQGMATGLTAGALGTEVPAWRLLLGGLVAGYGARLSGGCTSGHGICGMASLSAGSLAMVATFLTTGILTALTVAFLGAQP